MSKMFESSENKLWRMVLFTASGSCTTDLYADAYVFDDDCILFLSLWGLNTPMQEFLAKLSLSASERTESHLRLYMTEEDDAINWNCPKSGLMPLKKSFALERTTMRMHRPAAVFQGVIHTWLHHPLIKKPDQANHRMIILQHETESEAMLQQKLWEAVQTICPVPVLPHWQVRLLKEFMDNGWIKLQEGSRVNAYWLDFSSGAVETHVAQLVQEGQLTLNEDEGIIVK